MAWEVELTEEFEHWWTQLDEAVQDAIDRFVRLLEARGPMLVFPHSSDIRGAKHGNLRELRVQVGGEPYRIFYAFDPRRTAILLVGGNKAGDDQFYERMSERNLRQMRSLLPKLANSADSACRIGHRPEAWILSEPGGRLAT